VELDVDFGQFGRVVEDVCGSVQIGIGLVTPICSASAVSGGSNIPGDNEPSRIFERMTRSAMR